MKGFQKIDGLRVKFRTYEAEGGARWATAGVSIDDAPPVEIARIALDWFQGSGDPQYQAWVDCVSAAFNAWASRRTGEKIATKRAKANYRGEKL